MWGQQQQPQQQNTSGFFGGGGMQQQQPSFGGAPNFGGGTSQYGGGTTGYGGQQTGFQQQQQVTGMFGQKTATTNFTQASGQFGQTKPGEIIPQYYQIPIEQQLTTHGIPFASKNENLGEVNKTTNQQTTGTFHNIRVEQRFAPHSSQMLKVLDMLAMQKNGPQPTYEAIAQQEFSQIGAQQYPFFQKVTGGGGTTQGGMMGANQSQQTGWGMQNKPGFGGQSGFQQPGQQTSGFGQPQQTGMFGQASTQGAFGQQKPLFGQTTQQQPISSFGTQNTIKPMFGQNTTTPIFGQQATQQPGTGLFGGGQQQQTQFGQQQPQPLFGGGQQTPSFGAQPFGQAASGATGQQQFGVGAQQQTAGTSLFGQQPSQPGGLFGAGQGGIGLGATGAQIGGLTQQQSAPASGGLFGAKPATSNLFGGGGFGAQPTTQPTNLFGGTQLGAGTGLTQQAKPTGSLFGATPLTGTSGQQPQGSLFGAGSSPFGAQQPGTSLFGQQQPATLPQGMFTLAGSQQQQAAPGAAAPSPQTLQVPNPYGDPSKLADPFSQGSYLQAKSPFENAEAELKRIQEDIYKSSASKDKDPYKEITPLDRIKRGISNISETAEEDYVAPYQAPQYVPTNQERSHYKSLEDKFASKFKQQINQKQQQQTSISHQPKLFSVIQNKEGMYNLSSQKPLQPMKTFGTDSSLQMSRMSSQQSDRKEISPYDSAGKLFFRGNNGQQDSESARRTENFEPEFQAPTNEDILQIEVLIPSQQGFSQKSEFIKIHRTREVSDLYNTIRRLLKNEGRFTPEIKDFKLVSKGSLLNDTQSLQQAGIDRNTKVQVIYERNESAKQRQPDFMEEEDQFSKALPIQKQASILKIPGNKMPKRPKMGYETLPTWSEIEQMTNEELSGVSDFTVFNQYGQIQFIGKTDLTDVDLEEAITINQVEAEVYDEKKMGHRYPKVGEKLNRPALISFYGVTKPSNLTFDQFCDKLQKIAKQRDGYHIDYDEQGKQWTIKVEHFTNYKFNIYDDEPEAEVTKPQQQEQKQTLANQQPLSTTKQPQIQEPPRRQRRFNYPTTFQSNVASDTHMQLEDVQSETLSQAIRQDDIMIELQAPSGTTGQILPSIQEEREEIARLKREDIKRRILKRDQQIEAMGKLPDKPSLLESLQYLKGIGVQVKEENKQIQGFVKTPMKVNRCRPQFRPDGALLTVKRESNQITIRQVPTVQGSDNQEQRKTYGGLTDVLFKHTTINEGKKGYADLREQLDKMKLTPQQSQIIDQRMDPNLRSFQQPNQRFENYDDIYIQDALSNIKLPFVSFKKDPKDLFFFFESLAKYLVSKISSGQVSQSTYDNLTQEFYVVCTLNALFGNPNIPLVQIHNNWKGGLKTYDKLRIKFAENFKDSHSHEIGKKRRNALIDVIRFICMQEYRVDSKDQSDKGIYQQTVGHLSNGDIKKAVALLNSNQKTKAAMIVTNAFSSTLIRQAAIRGFDEIKAESPIKPLIDYLSGNTQAIKTANMNWCQALLYQLLVRSDPSQSLQEVVQKFAKELYDTHFKNQEDQIPLIWLLIRFYGLNFQEGETVNKRLWTYEKVIMYTKGEKHFQNHRLQFLISLTLFNLSSHVSDNIHQSIYGQQYSKFSFLHERLYNHINLYINQLLRNQDWKQALLVSQYIPVTFNKQRKQIVFQILQAKSMLGLKELDSEEVQEVQNFIFNQLQLPVKLFSISRAIQYQYLGQYERAIQDWMHADNHNLAHSIFMKHIAPLYFTPMVLGEQHQLLQSKDQENNLKDQIISLDNSRIYQDYQQQCFLITSFFKILDRFRTKGTSREALDKIAVQNIAKDLATMKEQGHSGLALIKRFIWEKLIQETIKQELTYRGREDLSGFEDLAGVYPDSPQLSRFYDEIAIAVNARNFCSDIRSGIYVPVSQAFQMEGISR